MSQKLTKQWMTACYFNLDPAQRNYAAFNAELKRVFGISVSRATYTTKLKEWNIPEEVGRLRREDAREMILNSMAKEDRGSLMSQVGSLNRTEQMLIMLLDRAGKMLGELDLEKDIKTVGQLLRMTETLMKAGSEVRRDMVDVVETLAQSPALEDDPTNVIALQQEASKLDRYRSKAGE